MSSTPDHAALKKVVPFGARMAGVLPNASTTVRTRTASTSGRGQKNQRAPVGRKCSRRTRTRRRTRRRKTSKPSYKIVSLLYEILENCTKRIPATLTRCEKGPVTPSQRTSPITIPLVERVAFRLRSAPILHILSHFSSVRVTAKIQMSK